MGARHRARAHSIQIMRVERVSSSKCRRVNIKQFHVSSIFLFGHVLPITILWFTFHREFAIDKLIAEIYLPTLVSTDRIKFYLLAAARYLWIGTSFDIRRSYDHSVVITSAVTVSETLWHEHIFHCVGFFMKL